MKGDMTKDDGAEVLTHYRTFNLCEAMCGLEIKVRGQEILSIAGDAADVFSRGHICPKAVALRDVYSERSWVANPAADALALAADHPLRMHPGRLPVRSKWATLLNHLGDAAPPRLYHQWIARRPACALV